MGKLFHKFQLKCKKGFTLFEVLVVVVILGVLALIAVPTYNKIIKKSRVSDGLHVLDMLAGAQDKYFVEHNHYAENLLALNPPFKDYRVTNPNYVYSKIETTNFDYNKLPQRHCITAAARVGGNYTLVKNYQTKEKVFCVGNTCSDIQDYVNEKTEEEFYENCPIYLINNCELTTQHCQNQNPNYILNLNEPCHCECNNLATGPAECASQGLTYNPVTCACDGGNGGDCNKTQEECQAQNPIYVLNTVSCACECNNLATGPDECERQGLTYNPVTCACDGGGGSECNKTEEECQAQNPNYILNLEEPCHCECNNLATGPDECERQGLTYNPVTCACDGGGNGACGPQPANIVEKCDNGNPETECGTRTTKFHCDETTNYQWVPETTDCENVDILTPTVDCTGEGWKTGCGVKNITGTCVKINDTSYGWDRQEGTCHYKDPSFNCGKPGWKGLLGSTEICRYCKKMNCGDDFPIALQNDGNCLRADTTWNGYIKTSSPSTTNPPPNTKQCFSCQIDPVQWNSSTCPVQAKCRNTYFGEAVPCNSYSNPEDLISLCTGGTMGVCYHNDNLCQKANARLVYRNLGVGNCTKYCSNPSCPQTLYFWEITHKVLRCLKRFSNNG